MATKRVGDQVTNITTLNRYDGATLGGVSFDLSGYDGKVIILSFIEIHNTRDWFWLMWMADNAKIALSANLKRVTVIYNATGLGDGSGGHTPADYDTWLSEYIAAYATAAGIADSATVYANSDLLMPADPFNPSIAYDYLCEYLTNSDFNSPSVFIINTSFLITDAFHLRNGSATLPTDTGSGLVAANPPAFWKTRWTLNDLISIDWDSIANSSDLALPVPTGFADEAEYRRLDKMLRLVKARRNDLLDSSPIMRVVGMPGEGVTWITTGTEINVSFSKKSLGSAVTDTYLVGSDAQNNQSVSTDQLKASQYVEGTMDQRKLTLISPPGLRLSLPDYSTANFAPLTDPLRAHVVDGNGRNFVMDPDPTLFTVYPGFLDLYLRDYVGDAGAGSAYGGALCRSPDIIVVQKNVNDSPNSWGGTNPPNSEVDNDGLSVTLDKTKDHHVYLRAFNRGGKKGAAAEVKATVYYTDPSTNLGNTALWWPIPGAAQGKVTFSLDIPPARAGLVVSNALDWLSADIPGGVRYQHYCFIATIGRDTDPDKQPSPGSLPIATVQDFLNNVLANNNLAWRNFDIYDPTVPPPPLPGGSPPPPDPGFHGFKFNFAAVPGKKDLQTRLVVEAKLPAKAWAHLDAPDALLALPKTAKTQVAKIGKFDRFTLDPQADLPFGKTKIPAFKGHDLFLWVKINKGDLHTQHTLVIRQLWEDIEIGRITWIFRPRGWVPYPKNRPPWGFGKRPDQEKKQASKGEAEHRE